MNVREALSKLNEIVSGVIPSFEAYPLYLHTETYFINALLRPSTPEKARYLIITLVISTKSQDDDEQGSEHRIGISVEVKHRHVSEDDIEEATNEFMRRVEETLSALEQEDCAEAVIGRLDKEAEAEYTQLVNELEESRKKMRIIAYTLLIVGAVILFVVATLS